VAQCSTGDPVPTTAQVHKWVGATVNSDPEEEEEAAAVEEDPEEAKEISRVSINFTCRSPL
jgi:hypothetical protein